jgi:hypothetical protein
MLAGGQSLLKRFKGDEAISGPLLSSFMFRQGDVSVYLDARLMPGGRDAQIAIAKRIISKL